VSSERMIATLPGVRASVMARRDIIKTSASSLFAAHNRPGGHRITQKTGSVDAFVFLEGPAASSLEFGHARSGSYASHSGNNPWVPGLHIMSKAARS
jgi:hypothetical protein